MRLPERPLNGLSHDVNAQMTKPSRLEAARKALGEDKILRETGPRISRPREPNPRCCHRSQGYYLTVIGSHLSS